MSVFLQHISVDALVQKKIYNYTKKLLILYIKSYCYGAIAS
jgi:hypothetical protein